MIFREFDLMVESSIVYESELPLLAIRQISRALESIWASIIS